MNQKIKSYFQVEREKTALQTQYGCLKPIQQTLTFEVHLLTYTNKSRVQF